MLKKLGFDYVLDTTFGADLVTVEEARIQRTARFQDAGPMFTSCCPPGLLLSKRSIRNSYRIFRRRAALFLRKARRSKRRSPKKRESTPRASSTLLSCPALERNMKRPGRKMSPPLNFGNATARSATWTTRSPRRTGSWASYFQLTPTSSARGI